MTPNSANNLSASIGRHGAYIWETKRILEMYIDKQDYDAVKEAVLEENLLRKGSERYREDILAEITSRYHIDKQKYSETPLIRVFKRSVEESIREWILYYEFSQDPVVSLLTTEFLYSEFHNGTLAVRKEDVIDFLDQSKSEYPVLGSWSENTLLSVAEHYLAAMKNFGLLEGNTKKEFRYVYLPDQIVSYVLYSLFEDGTTTVEDVIEDQAWKLLLMDANDVRDRLHDVSPSYVRYEKRGSVERLEPKYESLKECVDEF